MQAFNFLKNDKLIFEEPNENSSGISGINLKSTKKKLTT